MYHGEDSGHLMVHCNNKVMLIDFGVKGSKNYSFFLDEELFELHLTRENGRFSYELKHNEDIDSPHNRRRDQEKKTGRWRMIADHQIVHLYHSWLTNVRLYYLFVYSFSMIRLTEDKSNG